MSDEEYLQMLDEKLNGEPAGYADDKGRVKISGLVFFFRAFCDDRRANGLIAEKSNSLYCRENATDKEIERNILSNPFRRFEDMQMMRHTKTPGIVGVDSTEWRKLTDAEKDTIREVCEEKLSEYYKRIKD